MDEAGGWGRRLGNHQSMQAVTQMSDYTDGGQAASSASAFGQQDTNDHAALSGLLISWLNLMDFDERKRLTQERWKTCADALCFDTTPNEWKMLMERYGNRKDPDEGLDLSLLSSWFSTQHSVVLDKMLRRLMRTAVSQHLRIESLEKEQAAQAVLLQQQQNAADVERAHKINRVLRDWKFKALIPAFEGWRGVLEEKHAAMRKAAARWSNGLLCAAESRGAPTPLRAASRRHRRPVPPLPLRLICLGARVRCAVDRPLAGGWPLCSSRRSSGARWRRRRGACSTASRTLASARRAAGGRERGAASTAWPTAPMSSRLEARRVRKTARTQVRRRLRSVKARRCSRARPSSGGGGPAALWTPRWRDDVRETHAERKMLLGKAREPVERKRASPAPSDDSAQ